jgi:hypothetical protein
MNRDHQFDESFEADVRSVLRQTIVPPPVPEHVRYRVEAMDAAALPASRGPLSRWRSMGLPGPLPRFARRHPAALRVAASLAVVAALAGGAAMWARFPRTATVAAPSASAPVWSAGAMMLPQLAPNGAGFTYIDGTGLFVTADYGATWSGPRQIPAGDSPQGHLWDLGTLDFVDAQRGWMTGVTNDATGSKVTEYRTVDGGVTWKSVPISASTGAAGGDNRWVWATEHFTDSLHGRLQVGQVVSGVQFSSCKQWVTVDGGVSWTRTGDATLCFASQQWVTPELGYSSQGSTAQTVVTSDGGAGWHSVELTGPWSQYRPVMIAPDGSSGVTIVAAPGNCDADPSLAVMTSADGGATWRHLYDFILPGPQTGGLCFDGYLSYAGPDRWTVLIDDALWATQDGGLTWREVSRLGSPNLDWVKWWNDQQGLLRLSACTTAPAATDCSARNVLMVTSDGGRTWHHVPL